MPWISMRCDLAMAAIDPISGLLKCGYRPQRVVWLLCRRQPFGVRPLRRRNQNYYYRQHMCGGQRGYSDDGTPALLRTHRLLRLISRKITHVRSILMGFEVTESTHCLFFFTWNSSKHKRGLWLIIPSGRSFGWENNILYRMGPSLAAGENCAHLDLGSFIKTTRTVCKSPAHPEGVFSMRPNTPKRHIHPKSQKSKMFIVKLKIP